MYFPDPYVYSRARSSPPDEEIDPKEKDLWSLRGEKRLSPTHSMGRLGISVATGRNMRGQLVVSLLLTRNIL